MTFHIAPIVEGETEAACIQILLKRVWKQFVFPRCGEPVNVLEPFRSPKSSLVKQTDPLLERRSEEATRKLKQCTRTAGDSCLILVLLDADDDCPVHLAPQLLVRVKSARPDMDVDCVLANRELENWFKAAAESLAGLQGLPEPLAAPSDPELGSGDRWLTKQMQSLDRRAKYDKVTHPVEFAKRIDLDLCRSRSRSFRKLCNVLETRRPGGTTRT